MNRILTAVALTGVTALSFAFAATAADIANGKRVYDKWCEGCHGVETPLRTPLAGTAALRQRYKGAVPAALTERKDLTPELIRTMVRNGINIMPHSRKTEISDRELDDIVAFLTQPK